MSALRHFNIAVFVVSLGLAQPVMAQTGTDNPGLRAAAARVSPGDRILLQVVREPELNDSIVVTERGDAAFPKLGRLHVSSLTIAELQDTLLARYSLYLRSPAIQIKVLRRVVVGGEVRMPSVYYFDIATTLREAIARAGGITENGHRGKVAIIRNGTRIPLKDWDRAEGVAGDLQSGDQVEVGRKAWIVINAIPAISTAVVVSTFVVSLLRN